VTLRSYVPWRKAEKSPLRALRDAPCRQGRRRRERRPGVLALSLRAHTCQHRPRPRCDPPDGCGWDSSAAREDVAILVEVTHGSDVDVICSELHDHRLPRSRGQPRHWRSPQRATPPTASTWSHGSGGSSSRARDTSSTSAVMTRSKMRAPSSGVANDGLPVTPFFESWRAV
jgi:hypothetical protein